VEKNMVVVEKNGIKKYEEIIKDICNVENIYKSSKEEKDGALGVAMVLSYIDGVSPSVKNMAHHLNLSPFLLEDAFNNLRVNGVFSSSFNVINDPVFKGQQRFQTEWVSRSHATELAWCHIAGLAAGITGLKYCIVK